MAIQIGDTSWEDVVEVQIGDSSWLDVTEVQIAQEGPGETDPLEWVTVFTDVDLPAGPKPTLTQDGEVGGDVIADWTNNTNDHDIQIEWEIDGSSFDQRTLTEGTTQDTLDEGDIPGGTSEIRARLRYIEGAQTGEWGDWSDTLFYSS